MSVSFSPPQLMSILLIWASHYRHLGGGKQAVVSFGAVHKWRRLKMVSFDPFPPFVVFFTSCCLVFDVTDYGRTMKPFFIEIKTIWADKFWGIWGIFGRFISTHCPCFPLINHYLKKKLNLYFQIPNTYLGLGFEFGPQKIWDLAIVCP